MNKTTIQYFFILACFNLIANISKAQYDDFQNWNNISIEKSLNKKIEFVLQQDIRFQNNATMLKDYITVVGGNFKFNKHVKVQALYRYTLSNDIEDGSEFEHRLYADGMLKYKYQRFRFAYRLRYQIDWQDINRNRWHHIRNRFTVKYNIPKSSIEPFAQFEIYYGLNNPIQNSVDKTRYTLGLSYDITDYFAIKSFYRVQLRRVYGKKPVNTYILGLGASFSL